MPITKASSSAVAPGAKGDLVVGNATNDSGILAVGANGTTLVADSAEATGLKWATPAGGGKVLQVIQDDLTSNYTTTSTSYNDTGLTVTITPSSATSKILIMVSAATELVVALTTGDLYGYFALLRGATQLQEVDVGFISMANGGGPVIYYPLGMSYLDSPNTTSATTYKLQGKVQSGRTLKISASATKIASIIVMEIGA